MVLEDVLEDVQIGAGDAVVVDDDDVLVVAAVGVATEVEGPGDDRGVRICAAVDDGDEARLVERNGTCACGERMEIEEEIRDSGAETAPVHTGYLA